jgi:predicted Zn-dependent protease with MMP-like domain
MGNFKIMLDLMIIVAILTYPKSFSEFNNLTQENGQNILQICCTWGDRLNDGVLTFHTSNNNNNNQKYSLVTDSFEEWNSKLENVKFMEVKDASNADVLISFEHKGEETVGQTTSLLDEKGFIKSVKIRISVNFNEEKINEDTLSLVLKHEIGHALGLAHSNFHDLMNPIVNYQNKAITKCEIDAVKLANNWKLIENLTEPKLSKLPIEKTVDCDSEEM